MKAGRSMRCMAPAVTSLSVLLAAVVATGCGGHGAQGPLEPTDAASAVVGGYTFGTNSNRLTHPYFPATPTTAPWNFKGWGDFAGVSETRSFSDGGLVVGIKTLKMTDTWSGLWSWKEAWWFAQDTQGNVHALRTKVLQNDSGLPEPAQFVGVALGAPAAFVFPRPANTTLGRTWFWKKPSGIKVYRLRIASLSASLRGRSGLLRLEGIVDSSDDGVFNPQWGGPDERRDHYFARALGMYGSTDGQNPARGFVRQ